MTDKASEIPEGVRAVYEHCRSYTGVNRSILAVPDPCGGTTFCRLFREDDRKLLAMGIASCSNKEQYSKSIGRAISLGRALKALNDRDNDYN